MEGSRIHHHRHGGRLLCGIEAEGGGRSRYEGKLVLDVKGRQQVAGRRPTAHRLGVEDACAGLGIWGMGD